MNDGGSGNDDEEWDGDDGDDMQFFCKHCCYIVLRNGDDKFQVKLSSDHRYCP